MADTPVDPNAAREQAIIEEMRRRGMSIPDDPAAAPTGALGVANDIAKGVFVEGPGAVTRGVGNAVKETGDFVTEGLGAIRSATGKSGSSAPHPESMGNALETIAAGMSWLGEKVSGLYDKRETVTGNLIEGVSQFATGLIGAGKFKMLPNAVSTGGKVVNAMAKGAVVDMAVFDGNDKRLSNLIEEYPQLSNVVTDYLAADDNDPELLGRAKNAMEGLLIGPVADLFLAALKARKLFAKGDAAGAKAATDEAETMLRQIESNSVEPDGAAAKAADAEAPKVEGEAPVEPKPTDGSEAPAPYASDLPMPKDGRGPIEFKAGDVLPNVSKDDAAKTMEALQAKFTVAGREMVEEGKDFNFRTIANEDDLKAAINAVSAANEGVILRTKGGNADGVLTMDMLRKQRDEVAEMFMADPDHMMLALGNDAMTMQKMSSRFLAYKDMMQRAVNDAADLANKALANPGTVEASKAHAEALHSAMIATQIQAMVKGIQTNTARTLNAMKVANPSVLNQKGISDYEELANRLASGSYHGDDDKFLRHLAGLKGDPKKFVKYMEMTFGQRAKGAFNEWYLNALLSGPKTHVANFIGNAMMTGYMPIERAVAGMMPGSGMSTADVLTRMKDEYDGLGMALMDSFRIAGEALKINKSVLDPQNGSKIDPNGSNVGGLSARAWGLTKDHYNVDGSLIRTETTPYLSGMMDGLQAVVGIPSRLLTTGDELFKQLNYRSYLYVDAAAKARKIGLKTGSKEFNDFVAEQFTMGFDSNGVASAVSKDLGARAGNREISMAGLQQAREATFTQDLEYGFSRWLQGAANDNVFVKAVVPFVRTPVNIFRFAIKHGPLAPIEQGWRRDLMAGGDASRKAMAQLSTGMAMWSAGAWLANNGIITGGFSPDPEVRKVQEMNGAKEYAVKVGDKYIQYNRLDPFATVLGFAADFAKVVGHISDAESDKLGKAMTITLARNLMSKTYVQGLANMFNAISDATSGRSTTGLDSFLYRQTSSMLIPSLVNSVKGDDALREVRNMLDAVKVRMPGYSKEVPAVRNIIGEVVDAPQGWLLGAASPLGYGRDKNDALYRELGALMDRTGSPIARIQPGLGSTKIDLREVILEDGRNAYDRLQELLSKSGVKDSLNKLINTPLYKRAHDGSLDYPKSDGSKAWLIQDIMQRHREMARNMLLKESPALREMFRQETIREQSEGVRGVMPQAYKPPSVLQSLVGGNPNDLRNK